MNIYAKSGDKVVFSYPDNGYDGDREDGKKYLEVGRTYTVVATEIHNWNTDVWLEEVPNVRFNSVLFSDVKVTA